MRAQRGELLPIVTAVVGAKERCIFNPGVNEIGVGRGRLEMPDARKLPRMRRAVVPQVRAGSAVVCELISDRRPGAAAVIGALNDLAEPTGSLRCVEPVGVGGRAFDVIDFPAGKIRTAYLPRLTLAVGFKDERAFARSN